MNVNRETITVLAKTKLALTSLVHTNAVVIMALSWTKGNVKV